MMYNVHRSCSVLYLPNVVLGEKFKGRVLIKAKPLYTTRVPAYLVSCRIHAKNLILVVFSLIL